MPKRKTTRITIMVDYDIECDEGLFDEAVEKAVRELPIGLRSCGKGGVYHVERVPHSARFVGQHLSDVCYNGKEA